MSENVWSIDIRRQNLTVLQFSAKIALIHRQPVIPFLHKNKIPELRLNIIADFRCFVILHLNVYRLTIQYDLHPL